MKINALTTQLAVSPQIAVQDIPAIATAGYKSIICNRPDGEGADQPGFAEIEQAALAAGLTVRISRWCPARSLTSRPPNSHACWMNCPSRYSPTAAPACAAPPCGVCRAPDA